MGGCGFMVDKTVETEPKKVPPRNDFKASPLYRNSRALELQNRDRRFKYEFKTPDPKHPGYIEPKLKEHEIGTQIGGYATVVGWEPVQRTVDDKVKQVEARSDQGKPIDTLIRHGEQILCRIPVEEHAKYDAADAAYQDVLEKQIYSPERRGDGQASMTAVVSTDPNANHLQMLRNSGHALPGGQ